MALGVRGVEAESTRADVGTALAVAVKALDVIEVHCMLAHSSEDITRKTDEGMRIATKDQWGFTRRSCR